MSSVKPGLGPFSPLQQIDAIYSNSNLYADGIVSVILYGIMVLFSDLLSNKGCCSGINNGVGNVS